MLRCLYVDLDGTLLGPGGSLVHSASGGWESLGLRALEACHRADVEVVIYSGRRETQVVEDARLLGHQAYIFELGCGIVVDGEREWLTDGLEPRDGRTIHEQIADTGAPDLLLDTFAGRLEHHAPWHLNRDVSHLFRGNVDAVEVEELLGANGMDHLRLVDNGTLESGVQCYHLIPGAASKSAAIARHMQIRGYAREETLAAGDSREDLATSAVVGSFWLVANALERDPALSALVAARDNVRVAGASHGAGVYEAVVTTLQGG